MRRTLDSSKTYNDCDSAARFLSQLCPDSIKDNEVELGSPESFAGLLYRYPKLFCFIEDAKTSGDFQKLWETCVKLSRTQGVDPYFSCPERIPLVLGRIASNLKDLIHGKAKHVLWTLDQELADTTVDVKKVELHSLSGNREPPSMLFHELGTFQRHPVLQERVQRLFLKGQNTFLVNASATGKTRLLYEGLCQRWGFYVTCHADEGEARALDTTLDRRIYYDDLVRHLPHKSSLAFKPILAKNRKIAFRRFSAVLLAHLLIFRDFLKICSTDGEVGEIQKRRWLLAQLACHILDHSDPFREILVAIDMESQEFIDDQMTKVMKDVQRLMPESAKSDGFFVVIDEANVGIREIWFSQPEDPERYPALEEIIHVWRDRLVSLDITFVVAGTHIPFSYFPATSPQWSSWRWTSDTGSFDNPETQKRYVLSFLPPSIAQSPKADALFSRIRDWCRPRHRLTATLVAMLLMDGAAHPHGVLNHYIRKLIGFIALDAGDYVIEEGPSTVDLPFANIGGIVQGRPHVRSTAHEVIMHFIVTGKHPPCFGIGRVDLVSSGIGEFKDKHMSQISLDQPGPLIAAAVWLSDRSPYKEQPRSLTSFQDFCFYTQGHWANGDAYAPASYIALYLTHVLKNADNHLFSDVFRVLAPPAWLATIEKSTTRLVKLKKDEHGLIKEMIVTPSALLPDAPPLGYSACSADDVLTWLRHERPGVFCLCPPECEADLIFVLKHYEAYVWVMLRTSGRNAVASPDYVYPDNEREFSKDGKTYFLEVKYDAFRYITRRYLTRYVQMDSERGNRLSDDLLDALKGLPNGLAPTGHLSLLRVVATFPSGPTLYQQKTEGSPVAVLDTATFKTVTEAIPPQGLIQTLVSSMHGKRCSQYPDDAFSPVKSLSSGKQGTKRKTLRTSTKISPGTLNMDNRQAPPK
ncbi:hypothetical protein C0992_009093 [Termitomyces sp. T32_za158]|nr:hypothetical protein C0992_009093 [Termitomyces sp. T32_za158]